MTSSDLPHHPSYDPVEGTTKACPIDGWHNAPSWLRVKVILSESQLDDLTGQRDTIASMLGVIPDSVEVAVVWPYR